VKKSKLRKKIRERGTIKSGADRKRRTETVTEITIMFKMIQNGGSINKRDVTQADLPISPL
jgi:hypothetical protein